LVVCVPTAVTAQRGDQKKRMPTRSDPSISRTRETPRRSRHFSAARRCYSFEYEDAAEAFLEAQQGDASLAPAYWLEALTYSHVLWAEEKLEASRIALNRLEPTAEARLAQAGAPGAMPRGRLAMR
jgi:hypothetical protein